DRAGGPPGQTPAADTHRRLPDRLRPDRAAEAHQLSADREPGGAALLASAARARPARHYAAPAGISAARHLGLRNPHFRAADLGNLLLVLPRPYSCDLRDRRGTAGWHRRC